MVGGHSMRGLAGLHEHEHCVDGSHRSRRLSTDHGAASVPAEHATESKQTNASKHQNVPNMELPVQIASGVLAETPTRRQSYSSMHAMRLGIILVLPAGSVCPASLTGP